MRAPGMRRGRGVGPSLGWRATGAGGGYRGAVTVVPSPVAVTVKVPVEVDA